MRVMVFVKATEFSETGAIGSPDDFAAMGKFNAELVEARILLAADGLTPSSRGARVAFDGESRTVIAGPFAPAGALVAGFWIWEVKDLDEALAWVKRCPNPMPGPCEIEVRPLFSVDDIPELQTPEFQERRDSLRERLAGTLGPAGALGGLGA